MFTTRLHCQNYEFLGIILISDLCYIVTHKIQIVYFVRCKTFRVIITLKRVSHFRLQRYNFQLFNLRYYIIILSIISVTIPITTCSWLQVNRPFRSCSCKSVTILDQTLGPLVTDSYQILSLWSRGLFFFRVSHAISTYRILMLKYKLNYFIFLPSVKFTFWSTFA